MRDPHDYGSFKTEADLVCLYDDCGAFFTVRATQDTGWIEFDEEPICPDCGREVEE